MKVLAVVHYYVPENRAGAELMMHAMLAALVRAGHDVTVLATMSKARPYVIDGVRVTTGRSMLKAGDHDVVITHLLEAPRAHSWARRYDRPRVQVIHNTNRQTETSVPLGWDLLAFNADWISDQYARYDMPRLTVHPPVDVTRFRRSAGRMVTLINMIPDKGSEVFYALAERMPDVEFLAVEGGYLKHAQQRRRLPNVTWQANTGDMPGDVYDRTGVLLVPSSYESYGMVGIEACASGIPVIAHPTPGLQESLGSAAQFVDRDDLDAWEETVRAALTAPEPGPGLEHAAKVAERSERELAAWVEAVEAL